METRTLKAFKEPEKVTITEHVCPGCFSENVSIFYSAEDVPVHSVLLMATAQIATGYQRGDIVLGFCHNCGFISNLAFDESMLEYSDKCEESQGFSSAFNAFHHRLASHLIKRYDLENKDIIEIGCGKGEFLTLLCQLGNNRGVGFDPAYVSRDGQGSAKGNVTFVKDFFSEKYIDYHADFVCCKMTLEHICKPFSFMNTVRKLIGDRYDTVVFFQIPDVVRVLREVAFWDIYYEHCSYFSVGSLSYLFRKCNFEVLNTWVDYGGQYLMIEARPAGKGQLTLSVTEKKHIEETAMSVRYFIENYQEKQQEWKKYLSKACYEKQRVVLWGGGSKAVSFLSTLKIYDQIEYVVDINSYRQGTFIAGTGQEIVSPAFLKEYNPDIVIVMNPVYRDEIHRILAKMGLNPQLITM